MIYCSFFMLNIFYYSYIWVIEINLLYRYYKSKYDNVVLIVYCVDILSIFFVIVFVFIYREWSIGG